MATPETTVEIIEPWQQQMKAREILGNNRRQSQQSWLELGLGFSP
jgi:hypothetical protein